MAARWSAWVLPSLVHGFTDSSAVSVDNEKPAFVMLDLLCESRFLIEFAVRIVSLRLWLIVIYTSGVYLCDVSIIAVIAFRGTVGAHIFFNISIFVYFNTVGRADASPYQYYSV